MARIWHDLLTTQFREAGLTEPRTAPCLYKNEGKLGLCYVGDLLMLLNAENNITQLKIRLKKKFILEALGKPKQFLGMELS